MNFNIANHLQTMRDVLVLMEEKEYQGARKLLKREINRIQKVADEVKREERKKIAKAIEDEK